MIALLGDIGTDHDGFPPTPVMAASSDVFLDGKPVAVTGTAVDCGGVVIGSGSGQAG